MCCGIKDNNTKYHISYANSKNDNMSAYDKWHFCIEAYLRPRTLG